jgi:hypothetical protein
VNRDRYLQRKVRQRFLFAAVGFGLYFSLALNYLGDIPFLRASVPGTAVPVPLALYAGTIVVLLLLELLFLRRARRLQGELSGEERP